MKSLVELHPSQKVYYKQWLDGQSSTSMISLLWVWWYLLRTGELLALQAWQIHMTSASQPAVVNLGLTKSGKRQGAAESITLTDQALLTQLWAWKRRVPQHAFLTSKPHEWRAMFGLCLESLKLSAWEIRPYSLRRGGATHYFVKTGSLDRVLNMGRWAAIKTAKVYINSGLAMLADLSIPMKLLRPFHSVYHNWIKFPPSLEPTRGTPSRTGGRGKTLKRGKCAPGGWGEFPFFGRFSCNNTFSISCGVARK